MTAVPFDTLKLARSLREKSLFSVEQAEGIADGIAAAFTDSLATKADLREMELSLKGDLRETETGLKTDLRGTETRLKTDLRETETRLKTDLRETETRLKTEMMALKGEQVLHRWILVTIVGGVLSLVAKAFL